MASREVLNRILQAANILDDASETPQVSQNRPQNETDYLRSAFPTTRQQTAPTLISLPDGGNTSQQPAGIYCILDFLICLNGDGGGGYAFFL